MEPIIRPPEGGRFSRAHWFTSFAPKGSPATKTLPRGLLAACAWLMCCHGFSLACQPQRESPPDAACAQDYECPESEICANGACRQGCRADWDCQSSYCNPSTLSCEQPDAAITMGVGGTLVPTGPAPIWTLLPVERPGGSLRQPRREKPAHVKPTARGYLLGLGMARGYPSGGAVTLDPWGNHVAEPWLGFTELIGEVTLKVRDGQCLAAISEPSRTYERLLNPDCSVSAGPDSRPLRAGPTDVRVPHLDEWLLVWRENGEYQGARSGSALAGVSLLPERATHLHVVVLGDTAYVAAKLDGQLAYLSWDVFAGTTTAPQIFQFPVAAVAIESMSPFGAGVLVLVHGSDLDRAIRIDPGAASAAEEAAPWGVAHPHPAALAPDGEGLFGAWVDGNDVTLAHWSPSGIEARVWTGPPLYAPVVGCRPDGCVVADFQTSPSISPSVWHVAGDWTVSDVRQLQGDPETEFPAAVIPDGPDTWVGWNTRGAAYVRLLGGNGQWLTGPVLLDGAERDVALLGGHSRAGDQVVWVLGAPGGLSVVAVSRAGEVTHLGSVDLRGDYGFGSTVFFGCSDEACLVTRQDEHAVVGLSPVRLIQNMSFPVYTFGCLTNGVHFTSNNPYP
jgi:hypothetical protein